jgi:hypothetical protein
MNAESPAAPSAATIRRILGELDAEYVASIQALGPTEAELLEAAQWIGAEDTVAHELRRRPHGVVGSICEILAEQAEPEEP